MRQFLVAACALLALGGFFLGFSGSVDDAHITFWAAQQLGSSGEILNYNAERVEQSSALAQVLLLALLHSITGIGVVTLGHITTLLAALAALYCSGVLAQRLQVGGGASLAILATTPFFVYWSCSGMEGPLLALLLLGWVCCADSWLRNRRSLLALALVSLAAQMTRPEMPLVLCAMALCLFPVRAVLRLAVWPWRSLTVLLALQLCGAAVLTGWRWWYFGALAPQPVSAKVGSSLWVSLQHGLQYTQQTLLDGRLLLPTALAVLGTVYVLWRRRESLPLLVTVLLWLYAGFVVLSGGDWMAAGRFWVPVLPLLALLAALALQVCCRPLLLRRLLLVVVIIGHGLYLWRGTAVDFNGVPLWKKTKLVAADHAADFSFFERHAREHLHDIPTLAFVRPLVGAVLAGRPQGQPLVIMAGQMGMVPFYLAGDFPGRLRFIDRNGITERTLTHCPVTQGLLRTRNGIGTGYEWLLDNRAELASACGLVLPDIVFDIETGWNRRNIAALQRAGYVFIYRQRGHIVDEPADALLPLRKIGAGQFIAVSEPVWQQLGRPAPVERQF